MKCVTNTLLFCAHQEIAIRSHDETDSSKNKDNFFEFLHIRAKDNKLLCEYFVQNQHHYRYMSASYINGLVSFTAQQVLCNILKNIKEAEIFSITMDETFSS